MSQLGLEADEIDLREYFGNALALENTLARYGVLWVSGGNAFILKRAFEQSGMDMIVPRLLAQDTHIYAGYSAGTIMLTPTLKGVELCDDPDVVPAGYKAAFDWQGL